MQRIEMLGCAPVSLDDRIFDFAVNLGANFGDDRLEQGIGRVLKFRHVFRRILSLPLLSSVVMRCSVGLIVRLLDLIIFLAMSAIVVPLALVGLTSLVLLLRASITVAGLLSLIVLVLVLLRPSLLVTAVGRTRIIVIQRLGLIVIAFPRIRLPLLILALRMLALTKLAFLLGLGRLQLCSDIECGLVVKLSLLSLELLFTLLLLFVSSWGLVLLGRVIG
jgi:hypothetical protein